jgi:LemA protein
MKSIVSMVGAVVLAIVVFFGFAFVQRGRLIQKDEAAQAAWGQVEATLQRRLDLIPNLVETVRGAAKYEGETLVKITEGRNQVLALAKELGAATEKRDTAKMESLESGVLGSLRAFTGVATEAYPQLKGVDQFTMLQAELAGAENRVNVARQRYNEAVAALNASVRQWTWLPFCNGFATRETFRAKAGAEQPPQVDFSK